MATVEFEVTGYAAEIFLDKLTDEQVALFKEAQDRYLDDYNSQYIIDIDDFYDTEINYDTVQYLQGFYDFTVDAYFSLRDNDDNTIKDVEGNDSVYFEGELISTSKDDLDYKENHLEDGYYYVAQRVGSAQKKLELEVDDNLIDNNDPFISRKYCCFETAHCSEFPTALNREVNFENHNYLYNCKFDGESLLDEDGEILPDSDLLTDDLNENIIIIMQVMHGKKSIVYIYDDMAQKEKEHFFDNLDKTLIDMPIYGNNLITEFELERSSSHDNDDNLNYEVVNERISDVDIDSNLDKEDDFIESSYKDNNEDQRTSYKSDLDENYKYRDDEEYDIDDKDDGEYKR